MSIYNEAKPRQLNTAHIEKPPEEPLKNVREILQNPDLTAWDLIAAAKILDKERVKSPCDQEIAALLVEIYSLCSQLH